MSISIKDVRRVLAQLHQAGIRQISCELLYDALGADDANSQGTVRARINGLRERGEVTTLARGVYGYKPQAAPERKSERCQRIWRAVRSSKPGWSRQEIAQVTRVDMRWINTYCKWLQEEGYIAQSGRKGNTILFRATAKARERRETPYIPISPPDCYRAERNAACNLIRLMMGRELDKAAIRAKIAKECEIINKRFGGGGNDE